MAETSFKLPENKGQPLIPIRSVPEKVTPEEAKKLLEEIFSDETPIGETQEILEEMHLVKELVKKPIEELIETPIEELVVEKPKKKRGRPKKVKLDE